MSTVVISAIVGLLTALLPMLKTAGSDTLDWVITALINFLPVLGSEIQDIATPIKNIIAQLQSNTNVTPEQMQQLEQLDAQTDAAFEAAVAAAGTPPAGA
jgi:hypothetical protein